MNDTASKTIDHAALAQDLRDAHTAGLAAAVDVNDLHGSCNFDALTLSCRNTVKLRQAIASVGGDVIKHRGYVIVTLAVPGQGAKRTAAVEAMRAHLVSKGYPAGVYYQVD